MWYINQNDELVQTTNAEQIQVESLFQELLLWQGENPMNITLGIDYMGVFENRVFLKSSVEDICNKYADSFKSLVVGEPVYSDNGEILSLSIEITLLDDSTIKRDLMKLL